MAGVEGHSLSSMDKQEVLDFLTGLPKAELHLHIEGTLEPELLLTLAARNQVSIPFTDVQQVREALKFESLQSFLNLYYQACAVLLHEEDFFDLAWSYLIRAHKQNILHTEIMFDPQSHTTRGVALKTVVAGLKRACERAHEEFGLTTRLIACFLRHLGPEAAMETLTQLLPFKDHIVAVGMDSTELGYPPAMFKEVFSRAREEGFLLVAHAGEEGPPDYVWGALDLGVSRVDHGVRSLEDGRLMAHLRNTQVPLTVCPLSNLRLGVYAGHLEARLKDLFEAGVCITLNSDDPAYVGGYLVENYHYVLSFMDLTPAQVARLAENSFRSSFLPARRQQELCDQTAKYLASYTPASRTEAAHQGGTILVQA